MKHFSTPLLAALLLAGAAPAARAQEAPPATVVSVGAFGLAANAGAQVERRLGRHWSLGVRGARFFGADYPGYQAALLVRYYFRPAAPAGLYLQAQAGRFWHDAQVLSDPLPGQGPVNPTATTIGGAGGGLALGYQWLAGRRLAFGAALGLRFYPHHLFAKCDCRYLGDWYAAGQPGSVLDGQASVGYAF